MSKISFDIKCRPQIESGEYKVVTDVGEPVEVVKWDCKGKCPILAVIDDGDTHDSCFYDENGVSYSGKECIYILTDELELTEFEKEFDSCVENIQNSYGDDRKRNIRFYADTLLEIARKQLESEFQQAYEKGKATAERIDKSAQEWYEKGSVDAIADMQRSAWSKKDKEYINDLTAYFDGCSLQHVTSDIILWLKSLKYRMQPQPKQEWSEYDKMMFASIINVPGLDEQQKEWLVTCSPRPKQEWSEEDERQWNNIWDVLDGRFELSKEGYKNAADWFLKLRKSLRPQNRWKPSDELLDVFIKNATDFFESNFNSLTDGGVIGVFDDKKKMIDEFKEYMNEEGFNEEWI